MEDSKDKVIAVVGVSSNEGKYGHKIFKDLLEHQYNVFGVNPKGETILGKQIYKQLSDIPKKVDTVIIVVKPEITEKIVKECKKLNIKEIWMQPGSESEAAKIEAEESDIKIIESCFMVGHDIW